jgi:hypothetical protein
LHEGHHICLCADVRCPDWSARIDNELLTDEALTFDQRFDSAFDVELRHTPERTFTPAEALMAVLQEAKGAREAYRVKDLMDDDLKDFHEWIKRLQQEGDKDASETLKLLHQFLITQPGNDDTQG